MRDNKKQQPDLLRLLFCLLTAFLRTSAKEKLGEKGTTIRLQHEGRCGVNASPEFLIQHIETFGIRAKEFHFLDEIGGIDFFFALFFYKPIQELHCSEVFNIVCGTIYIIYKALNIKLRGGGK
mgnify:CR=1 FL=1